MANIPAITALDVLIVEDHEPMRLLLRKTLERAGAASVRDAANGEAALALLAERAANLILADHHMPGMSGHRFVMLARASGSTARIVMITGRSDAATADAARTAGADAVLVKPITPSELLTAIEAMFG